MQQRCNKIFYFAFIYLSISRIFLIKVVEKVADIFSYKKLQNTYLFDNQRLKQFKLAFF